MRSFLIAALLAATAFTPALAQDGEGRRERNDAAVRQSVGGIVDRGFSRGGGNGGGEYRRRSERQATAPAPVQQQVARPDGGDGGGWRRGNRGNDQMTTAPRQGGGFDQGRRWRGRDDRGPGVTPAPVPQGQSVFDRDRDGRADPYYDRNRNGRVDKSWDKNRDGSLDKRWDRNRDGNLDQRWDRNADGRLDRRWDRNGNGKLDKRHRQPNYGYGYGYGSGHGSNWNHGSRHGWNHGWRNDNRYDWNSYRSRYSDYYRLPRYSNPYGYNYGYRSFGIGSFLDELFYGSRYWLREPSYYRLPDAPYGARWVRYYDDVLLVDMRNGEVIDVIRNFFW
jgi:Nickel/cobalt transporter regulator